MMAGWIDTAGLKLFLNERVSFMTGRAAELGEWLAKGEIGQFGFVVVIVIMFITGAAISAIITRRLGLMGGLTFAGGLLLIAALCIYKGNMTFAGIAIPMAMGGQNAATSLTSINRTTHLTGPATDIGLNIAYGNWDGVIFWVLHWVAFPIGSFVGYNFIQRARLDDSIHVSLTLIIPAIIIILTGIIQRIVVDIPLIIQQRPMKKEKAK